MHSLIVWLFISFFRRFTSKFSWSSAWTSLNSFLNDWKWSVDSVNSSPFPARVPVNGLAKPARHNSWWRTKDGPRKSLSKQLSSPWDDTKLSLIWREQSDSVCLSFIILFAIWRFFDKQNQQLFVFLFPSQDYCSLMDTEHSVLQCFRYCTITCRQHPIFQRTQMVHRAITCNMISITEVLSHHRRIT